MNNNNDVVQYPGQVVIADATITSRNGVKFNILGQIAGIEIFEDIFSPFMTGKIYVLESLDIKNLFPLIGEEILNLHIYTPSLAGEHHINQEFYLYKLSDGNPSGDRSEVYALHFISVEAIQDINVKISKTFGGQVSKIVEELMTNSKYLNISKKTHIEDTISTTKYISNYWSPMKNIAYLMGHAKNVNGAANYVFFESRYSMNFVSLDWLYEQDVKRVFIKSNYAQDIENGTSYRNIDRDYMTILDFRTPQGFDYIDRARSGMFANKLITVDPVTKKFSDTNYYSVDEFSKFNHLNQFPITTVSPVSASDQAIIYTPKHYGNFNGCSDSSNASIVQRRTSQMKSADANKIVITVFGRTDYTVGQKVYVQIPAFEAVTNDGKQYLDEISSGNYLIASIAHRITFKEHMIEMELMKDSFTVNANEGKK